MLRTSRNPFGIGLALIVTLAPMLTSCGTTEVEHPNLILVSLDTLRADHISSYGYERETTPHLDAFSQEAVVFENALAQASATIASHRSLFQSRLATATGRERPALAEVLRDAGYRTGAFTGGGNISGQLGFSRGFEVYDEDYGGLAASLPKVDWWLMEADDRPIFLFLHTYDIHLPYDPPAPYDSMFSDGYEGPLRGDVTRETARTFRGLDEVRDAKAVVDLSEADRHHMVALYDGGIRYTDTLVGQFLQMLDEKGLLESSVVIFFSDHGEEFWDHDSLIHSHTLYQELLHVPLIVRLPGGLAPRRVNQMVRLLDLSPTILDLLGIEAPDSFLGTSLRPLLEGRGMEMAPSISEQRRLKAIVEPPWKLIRGPRAKSRELYRLDQDPGEQRNLIAENPAIAKRFQDILVEALADGIDEEVLDVDPDVEDAELQERLRALGYLD